MDEDTVLAAIAGLGREQREFHALVMARFDRLERRLRDMRDHADVSTTLATIAASLRNETRPEMDLLGTITDLYRQVRQLQGDMAALKRPAP